MNWDSSSPSDERNERGSLRGDGRREGEVGVCEAGVAVLVEAAVLVFVGMDDLVGRAALVSTALHRGHGGHHKGHEGCHHRFSRHRRDGRHPQGEQRAPGHQAG